MTGRLIKPATTPGVGGSFQTPALSWDRPKARRQSKPKVRTGCVTCKSRRVKCDEGRPSCRRCVRRGLECGGYVPITTLTFELSGDGREIRSYQYFHERSAKQLTGFYDHYFWNELILPSSRYEPSIRHALAALGGLHESIDLSWENRDRKSRLESFACEQYGKSICHLTSKSHPPTSEVAMITCLLFMCYETLSCHPDQVSTLFRQALHLAENSKYSQGQPGVIQRWIIPVLARWRYAMFTSCYFGYPVTMSMNLSNIFY